MDPSSEIALVEGIKRSACGVAAQPKTESGSTQAWDVLASRPRTLYKGGAILGRCYTKRETKPVIESREVAEASVERNFKDGPP